MNFFLRLQHCLDRHTYTGREGLKFQAAALSLASLLLAPCAAAQSFDNGFEDGLGGWVRGPSADPIEIVGSEGPGQFAVYADLNVTVEPYNGDFMLRLGTPKLGNETQTRGINRISQAFVANTVSVSLALRLFSLDHRGDDTLRFSLVDSTGFAVPSTDFNFGNAVGDKCRNPCSQVIDTGKRNKDVIKTDWQVVKFTVEPGESYTFVVELEAGQNESLASWLYIEGVNEGPTAVIN